MDLRLRIRTHNEVVTVEVGGEIDLHSAPQLRAELVKAAESARPRIVVDLADVTFIDSTGIGVLVGGLKRAREKGGSLAFSSVQPRVKRVLEITGLLRALPLYASREAAHNFVSADPEDHGSLLQEATDGR